MLARERGGRAGRHDHLNVQGDQFGDQRGKALILSLRPAILDGNVAALLVAERTQPVAEWPDEIRFKLGGRVAQETDSGDFRGRLLRARRQRPRRRTAEQRDELAALQLIESHSVPSQGRIAGYRISENQSGGVLLLSPPEVKVELARRVPCAVAYH